MLCDFQIESDAMSVIYMWNYVQDGWSPPAAGTDNNGNPTWAYPFETHDLTFPGPVSMTVVAGISSFSAAYMAYVGFTQYSDAAEGIVDTGSNFWFPQGQALFMPSLTPFVSADNLLWVTVAYGLIPAGVRITDQPAGMSSPTSGLSITVVGYD
jgi:hypothetical protein